MKQLKYTIGVFVIIIIALLATYPRGLVAESDAKFVLEKDGCKVYSFKVAEAFKYKTHFFITCRGAVLDKEDFNVTELEENAKN